MKKATFYIILLGIVSLLLTTQCDTLPPPNTGSGSGAGANKIPLPMISRPIDKDEPPEEFYK